MCLFRADHAMKILIIDDSVDACQIAAARLAKEPVEICCAHDGSAGLEAASRERPDLVLLDLDMPDMSGFDVCRALKADPDLFMIPILFLSGSSTVEDKIKGLDLGAIDYVTKPFHGFELCARVRAASQAHAGSAHRTRAHRPSHGPAQPPGAAETSPRGVGPHGATRRQTLLHHG